MKITIKQGVLGRYDDVSPFVIAEDLRLDFEGLNAANGDYCVVVKLNGRDWKYKLNREKTVTIGRDCLEPGELNVSVIYYLRGQKLTEYIVEPLLLRDVDMELTAEPHMAALTAQIAELKEEIAGVRNELTETQNRAQSDITRLAAEIAELRNRVDIMEGGYDPLQV